MLKVVQTHATKLPGLRSSRFDNNTVLWIDDSVEYDVLDNLLLHTGRPKYMVNDNTFGHHGRDIFCVPWFLAKEVTKFQDLVYDQDTDTRYCFNFSINKKNENRNLLLKLLEYFDLHTESYTWSGVAQSFDLSRVIQELDTIDRTDPPFGMSQIQYQEFRCSLLSACQIPARFIPYPGQVITDGAIKSYGGNVWTWQNGLDKIYKQTAVSLISETVEYQKTSCVTEKTAYAVFALTFPIWVGAYGIAQAWKKAGFDCFDDVIDHSYQFKETLVERCYYAFHDNKVILQNLELAQNLRQRCRARLLCNRQKLLAGALTDYCDRTIDTWPQDLADVAKIVLQQGGK